MNNKLKSLNEWKRSCEIVNGNYTEIIQKKGIIIFYGHFSIQGQLIKLNSMPCRKGTQPRHTECLKSLRDHSQTAFIQTNLF